MGDSLRQHVHKECDRRDLAAVSDIVCGLRDFLQYLRILEVVSPGEIGVDDRDWIILASDLVKIQKISPATESSSRRI